MPKISSILSSSQNTPTISWECYPPRTDVGVENLRNRLSKMSKYRPAWLDWTWGAGGSTSDLTLSLSQFTQNELNMETNMHLTCTNMPREKVDIALNGAKESNITNIVALRGDPPKGQENWEAIENGFTCALDLVRYIKENHGDYFNITVAGYPEGHPDRIVLVHDYDSLSESEKKRCSKKIIKKKINEESDEYELIEEYWVCKDEEYEIELNYLKEKVDAGADMIITQLFFDPEVFYQFVEDCHQHDINIPIIPGIMCLQNKGGFERMIGFCKTRVPDEFRNQIEACEDSDMKDLSIELITSLCQDLLAHNYLNLHFYMLNLEKVVVGVMKNLGFINDDTENTNDGDENLMAVGTIVSN